MEDGRREAASEARVVLGCAVRAVSLILLVLLVLIAVALYLIVSALERRVEDERERPPQKRVEGDERAVRLPPRDPALGLWATEKGGC